MLGSSTARCVARTIRLIARMAASKWLRFKPGSTDPSGRAAEMTS
jgi:hypothetical protein